MNVRKETLEHWTVEDSAELYGIRNWGAGYFDISENGEVVTTPYAKAGGPAVNLVEIIKGIKDRGMGLPVLLRVSNILDTQLSLLHESFRKAIAQVGYSAPYKGVYPIKVNQQQQVLEEIARFGADCHHGLEAGSKAELIAAIGTLRDPEACLICNGYKDEEFIDLGLYARKLGLKCFFVIEMPSEAPIIIERSRKLGVKPLIGVRVKLSTRAGGQWAESGGDRSVFGLNTAELIEMVDLFRKENMLDCLKLLHYHIGSQIPNIRDIRSGILEACRVYCGLVQEGAPMGFLDLGGGLAVDYDGSHTNFPGSRNYTLDEYCVDILETVAGTMNDAKIAHPVIITESGRATIAYYSVLIFNILDATKYDPEKELPQLPEDSHELTRDLLAITKNISSKNLQECLHDAIYCRDEIRQLFKAGRVSLRERACSERIFWHIISSLNREAKKLKYVPDEFESLDSALADIYYANFSVFQSLPDSWAIDQVFPIMPLHRLCEAPARNGIISDITCDCDGKIDRFVDLHDVRHTLPLHELVRDEEYYLGAFLVGAYQETLGDLHNLMGDTNVVSVTVYPDGRYEIVKEIEGDSVESVLSYVEFEPKALVARFRESAENAVRQGIITPNERKQIMDAYEAGLRGYTYFER